MAAYCSIAAQHGCTVTSLSIRWLMQQPSVSSIVLGASSPEQLCELMQATRAKPLDAAILQAIDDVHSIHKDPCP